MIDASASPQEVAPGAGLDVAQLTYGLPEAGEPPPNSFHSSFRNSLAALPRTSLSVMVVIDENGYLTPLLTAGDLLRWCKAAWRAEQD
jgi:hypothetical protein